eukprot:CAMPEP_0197520390 /NCGR_PEP_ID=MMETSP1318-20131121/5731_1 /TAXON_ID=552666 /ORGANISM="Partenskyella glossopodia, Strain RCC365" /LENGTH=144 /DNA_ID=CAMNT_0043071933 /DNA_START=78 /DNA_END=512 /DNA_ORIENTATION=+
MADTHDWRVHPKTLPPEQQKDAFVNLYRKNFKGERNIETKPLRNHKRDQDIMGAAEAIYQQHLKQAEDKKKASSAQQTYGDRLRLNKNNIPNKNISGDYNRYATDTITVYNASSGNKSSFQGTTTGTKFSRSTKFSKPIYERTD